MSMFDKETQLKNAEFAENGQAFTLFSCEPPVRVNHAEFGDNMKAEVKAGPVGSDQGDAETYVVFGVMAEQCGRMKPGDLPETVKIGQDGRAKVLQRASSE